MARWSGRTWVAAGLVLALLAACSPVQRRDGAPTTIGMSSSGLNAGETPELRRLIEKYAREHEVPVSLVHRVVHRESRYNPDARNGPYFGLMQMLPQTARTMGYRGEPAGLLDAETNLKYGVKYLRGAWMVADGSADRAIMWYAKGYYYEAKRRGLLYETGLRN